MSERSAVVAGVGASRGLGAAVARRFAREGFRITVIGRSAEKLGATLEELRKAGAKAEAVIGDVTDEGLVRRAVAQADAADAPLEAAVFNAGGNWPKAFLEMDAAFLDGMWRVNALAGFFFAKAALEAMLPRQRGSLLFTGASASLRGAPVRRFARPAACARWRSRLRASSSQGIHVAKCGGAGHRRHGQYIPAPQGQRGPDGLARHRRDSRNNSGSPLQTRMPGPTTDVRPGGALVREFCGKRSVGVGGAR